MGLNDLDEAPVIVLVLERALEQGLGVPANGRQGSAQLVGDVGHKVLAHALQALEVGDIVQDGQGARAGRRLERRGLNLKRTALGGGEREALLERLPTGQYFGQHLDQPGIAHQLDERQALRNRTVPAEEARE